MPEFILWCLDPSIVFYDHILSKNPHNIILTSGTIAPFDSWESEIKINF